MTKINVAFKTVVTHLYKRTQCSLMGLCVFVFFFLLLLSLLTVRIFTLNNYSGTYTWSPKYHLAESYIYKLRKSLRNCFRPAVTSSVLRPIINSKLCSQTASMCVLSLRWETHPFKSPDKTDKNTVLHTLSFQTGDRIIKHCELKDRRNPHIQSALNFIVNESFVLWEWPTLNPALADQRRPRQIQRPLVRVP
jgi:hypothetical protein